MRAIICAIWVAIISVEDALLDVAPPTPETEPFSICIQLFGYRDLVVEARTQDQWGQACVVQQHWLVDTADWFAAETAVIVAVGLAELAEPTAILQLGCVNLVFDIGPSNGILLITHRLQRRAVLGRSLIRSYKRSGRKEDKRIVMNGRG